MIPDDFKELLPKHADVEPPKDHSEREYLWVYDPQENIAHVEKRDQGHPADFLLHDDIAKHVVHPDRKEGYAWPIKGGGWRIVDNHYAKLDDPYTRERIRMALRRERPAPLMPNIRYHGNPK